MPWFRLDDSFDTHPKVLAAGNEAIGLYIRCGTYAARNLTDGLVGQDIAHLYGALEMRRGSDETLAATLVRVRLWHRTRGGWRIHDFLDYNPSREDVLSRRKVRAEAGRLGGLASGKTRSKPQANASRLVEPPARPDPSVVSVVADASPGTTRPNRKPGFHPSHNGAATRQPIPFADAIDRALNPDGGSRGRHARQPPKEPA